MAEGIKGKNKGHENLIPVKPGECRNPSGRPKMPAHFAEAFRGKLTEKSLAVLEAILDGSDDEAKASDRLKAAEICLARAWGNPVQAVDLDPNENNALQSIRIEFVKPNDSAPGQV